MAPFTLWMMNTIPIGLLKQLSRYEKLLEKIPRVIIGIGVQANTSGLSEVRRGIYERILKDKKHYAEGWKGNTINSHFDKTLRKIEDYLDRNQQPTRKETVLQRAVGHC